MLAHLKQCFICVVLSDSENKQAVFFFFKAILLINSLIQCKFPQKKKKSLHIVFLYIKMHPAKPIK